jgi:hypothetical protein
MTFSGFRVPAISIAAISATLPALSAEGSDFISQAGYGRAKHIVAVSFYRKGFFAVSAAIRN